MAHWLNFWLLVSAQVRISGSWDEAPYRASRSVGSLPVILPLSPSAPTACFLSLSLSIKNIKKWENHSITILQVKYQWSWWWPPSERNNQISWASWWKKTSPHRKKSCQIPKPMRAYRFNYWIMGYAGDSRTRQATPQRDNQPNSRCGETTAKTIPFHQQINAG